MRKRIAFHTLGCKLNYSETSSLQTSFSSAGYEVVPFDSPAEIYVINTCSVTDFADRKCRKSIRRAKSLNDEAFIVVTGCYAQLKPEEISALPEVNLVLGTAEKFDLLNYVRQYETTRTSGLLHCSDIQLQRSFESSFSYGDRTRVFLKIQDGCDYKCSFCTIPKARGISRSDTIDNVVEQVKKIVEKGSKEIVLTGVNIGDFGKSEQLDREESLLNLLKALDLIEGLERCRVSSIEPNLCSDQLIEFIARSRRIVPHFHMPLQSGDDRILRLMRRRYNTSLYESRVHLIKDLMPHASVGVDVIVGFPGETEEHFQNTFKLLSRLEISYLHVFTYSERDNTDAINYPLSVPIAERRKRNGILRQLSDNKKTAFYNLFAGSCRQVLLETSQEDGFLAGYTDNYLRVRIPYTNGLANTLQYLSLDRLAPDGIFESSFLEPEPLTPC